PPEWIFSGPSPDLLDLAERSWVPDLVNVKEKEIKRNIKTKRAKSLLSSPKKMIRDGELESFDTKSYGQKFEIRV
uniref:Uncharacterized protein n=1 Tax=Cucumis melo TaxID=3656 RepID=A0A9I9D1F9_CUCME